MRDFMNSIITERKAFVKEKKEKIKVARATPSPPTQRSG